MAELRNCSIDARSHWLKLYNSSREAFAQLKLSKVGMVLQSRQVSPKGSATSDHAEQNQRAETQIQELFDNLEELFAQCMTVRDMDFKLLRWDKEIADMQLSEYDMFDMPKATVLPWPASATSQSGDRTPEIAMPEIVHKYFELMGDVGIYEEQLLHDIPEKKAGELAERQRLRDQNQRVVPKDEEFEAQFALETSKVQQELDKAKAEMKDLAAACQNAGYSIDQADYIASRAPEPPNPHYKPSRVEHWLEDVSDRNDISAVTAPGSQISTRPGSVAGSSLREWDEDSHSPTGRVAPQNIGSSTDEMLATYSDIAMRPPAGQHVELPAARTQSQRPSEDWAEDRESHRSKAFLVQPNNSPRRAESAWQKPSSTKSVPASTSNNRGDWQRPRILTRSVPDAQYQ